MTRGLKRVPAVAGAFYPEQPAVLRRTIQEYLDQSEVRPAESGVRALVVPHAGYIYSGPTAAYAFRRAAECDIDRVILLGCSHRYSFEGPAIYAEGSFDTPLGEFPIDEDFAARLAERTGNCDPEPHAQEHSLEVELPFISMTFGNVPIVPVLFGSRFGPSSIRFAKVLAELAGDRDLVLASTDLSHYLTESQANEIDRRTIDTLLTKDVEEFVSGAESGRCSVCGLNAVATAMVYSHECGAEEWSLLDYSTSARASGDTSRVVGYAAISMESN